uniref:Beta-defensin-like domain-containing protein n=1 Tax=Callorhinchus milii TaxID=7868 RepID=A0A4W3GAC5_CALMI
MHCLVLALSVLFMAQGVVTNHNKVGRLMRLSFRDCESHGGICADSCLTTQRPIGFCSDVEGICCR